MAAHDCRLVYCPLEPVEEEGRYIGDNLCYACARFSMIGGKDVMNEIFRFSQSVVMTIPQLGIFSGRRLCIHQIIFTTGTRLRNGYSCMAFESQAINNIVVEGYMINPNIHNLNQHIIDWFNKYGQPWTFLCDMYAIYQTN